MHFSPGSDYIYSQEENPSTIVT